MASRQRTPVVHTGHKLTAWDDTSVTIDGQHIPTGPDRIIAVDRDTVTVVDASRAEHGYHGYQTGCRCDVCTSGASGYSLGYRAARRQDLPGGDGARAPLPPPDSHDSPVFSAGENTQAAAGPARPTAAT